MAGLIGSDQVSIRMWKHRCSLRICVIPVDYCCLILHIMIHVYNKQLTFVRHDFPTSVCKTWFSTPEFLFLQQTDPVSDRFRRLLFQTAPAQNVNADRPWQKRPLVKKHGRVKQAQAIPLSKPFVQFAKTAQLSSWWVRMFLYGCREAMECCCLRQGDTDMLPLSCEYS